MSVVSWRPCIEIVGGLGCMWYVVSSTNNQALHLVLSQYLDVYSPLDLLVVLERTTACSDHAEVFGILAVELFPTLLLQLMHKINTLIYSVCSLEFEEMQAPSQFFRAGL